MMRIAPGYFPPSYAALVEEFFTFNISVAISLPGFRSENGNVFQKSHGWHAINNYLSGLPPGREAIILIHFSSRGVSLSCGQHVLLGEPSCLHDLFQGLCIDSCAQSQNDHAEKNKLKRTFQFVYHLILLSFIKKLNKCEHG